MNSEAMPQDKFGNEIEIISDRGRYWYVKNLKSGKCFMTNKNEIQYGKDDKVSVQTKTIEQKSERS